MNTKLIGALLAACAAALALPALAGADAPASSTRASGVMKASHRAHRVQAISPDNVAPTGNDIDGVEPGKSQSGRREPADSIDPMYRGG